MNKKYRAIKYTYYFFISIYLIQILIFKKKIYAQSFLNSPNISNLIWYDGDQISINKNTETFSLDGNANILLGKMYLSSHRIIIQKNIGIITAEGNVNLINNKIKVSASRIVFDINTQQLRMDNAQLFSDPEVSDEKILEETLGFSKAEIAFENAKETRTKEIENELKFIREEYSKLRNLIDIRPENASDLKIKLNELTKKYSRYLARLSRTQFQPNTILAALPDKEREKTIEKRKAVEQFNKDNPQIAKQISNFSTINGYVKIAASTIIQKNQKTLLLNNAIVTTCNCNDSIYDKPIYSFSTQTANIEIDNYVTMKDVTLDLFSIPLFYSPWLKFPIKTKRESGFLTPSSYMSSNSGSALALPYFIVIGPYADSTITYEYFSERGSQFSGEFRFQIEKDSQLKTEVKYIKDKSYQNEWSTNSTNLDNYIKSQTDPTTIAMYNNFRGSNLENRWYSASSINIPLLERLSIKANAQFVSDNTYLSDYSNNNLNISPTAAVYGDTSNASKRFLNQELNSEYYGDNFVLSIRSQGIKDLFAAQQNNTPNRMPLIEFTLLPDRYLDTPFVFSNFTTWENIYRPNHQNYIPLTQNVISPQPIQNNPSVISAGNSNLSNEKSINDPYAKGNRLFTSSTISLPLSANDYINANLSTTFVGTQYYFANAYPFNNEQPYLGYLQHKAYLDIPIYSTINFYKSDYSSLGNVTHNITPFIDFDYIPEITRSSNFPNTYQSWYAQDNTVSKAIATLGVTSSWTIQKEDYSESKEPIPHLPPDVDTGVANLNFFSESVKENKLNISSDSKDIFQFSSETEANKTFDLWAKKELENYYTKISIYEFKQNYVWPAGNFYFKKIIWKMTPLSISVSTGYNLLADKTAYETNLFAGSLVSPVPVQKNTPIVASTTINLNPILPLQTTVNTSYNQYYKRIDNVSTMVNTTLPFGLSISYTNNQQFVINPTSTDSNNFIKKTQQTADITYTPLKWLQLGYQWSKNTDPTTTTDLSNGKAYGSSQNISFLNLQNCLDLSFARNKPAGYTENQATYVFSINFRFFGYSYNTGQLGDYVNRNLQN